MIRKYPCGCVGFDVKYDAALRFRTVTRTNETYAAVLLPCEAHRTWLGGGLELGVVDHSSLGGTGRSALFLREKELAELLEKVRQAFRQAYRFRKIADALGVDVSDLE